MKAHVEAKLDKAVLVQAASAYAFDNSYVADAVAAHPERFTGVFSVDVVAPDAAATMKRWMAKGLTGLRIFTSGSTHAEQETFFADEAAFPAWSFASDQGLSVCMQMRVAGLPLLETVLKRFPSVPVILDHFARAEADDGPPFAKAAPLWALSKYPNVYLKLTHRPIEQSVKGKATPRDVPRQGGGRVRRTADAVGLELSRRRPAAARIDRDGAQGAFLRFAPGPRLDLRQDRPVALSGAGALKCAI